MNEDALLAVAALGAIAGGGLGAKLSRAPVWKGMAATAAASAVQIAADLLFTIGSPVLSSGIYVVALALIGGRFGLGLSIRQLAQVVIGSFLFALLAGLGFVSLAGPAGGP